MDGKDYLIELETFFCSLRQISEQLNIISYSYSSTHKKDYILHLGIRNSFLYVVCMRRILCEHFWCIFLFYFFIFRNRFSMVKFRKCFSFIHFILNSFSLYIWIVDYQSHNLLPYLKRKNSDLGSGARV